MKYRLIVLKPVIKWQKDRNTSFSSTKGQLISKCLFGVIDWTKKPTIFFSRISKKWLNQKLYHMLYHMYRLFYLGIFHFSNLLAASEAVG